jgi:hypothetical protein
MPTHHLAGHEKQTRPFVRSLHVSLSTLLGPLTVAEACLSSWRWRSLVLKGDLDSGEVVADRGGIGAAFSVCSVPGTVRISSAFRAQLTRPVADRAGEFDRPSQVLQRLGMLASQ